MARLRFRGRSVLELHRHIPRWRLTSIPGSSLLGEALARPALSPSLRASGPRSSAETTHRVGSGRGRCYVRVRSRLNHVHHFDEDDDSGQCAVLVFLLAASCGDSRLFRARRKIESLANSVHRTWPCRPLGYCQRWSRGGKPHRQCLRDCHGTRVCRRERRHAAWPGPGLFAGDLRLRCRRLRIFGAGLLVEGVTLVSPLADVVAALTGGLLPMGLGFACFLRGAPFVPAAAQTVLAQTETIFGPVWVWLAFGEAPGPRLWSAARSSSSRWSRWRGQFGRVCLADEVAFLAKGGK